MGKFQKRLVRDLTLYVQQLAWLHATPKPDPKDKTPDEDKPPPKSHLEAMKADRIKPALPPNPAPHIIDRLIEIGLTEAAGMGSGPLSWREINEWQAATFVTLDPWEARLIHSLSRDYVAENRAAEDRNRPSPFRAPITQREIELEDEMLRSVLG